MSDHLADYFLHLFERERSQSFGSDIAASTRSKTAPATLRPWRQSKSPGPQERTCGGSGKRPLSTISGHIHCQRKQIGNTRQANRPSFYGSRRACRVLLANETASAWGRPKRP